MFSKQPQRGIGSVLFLVFLSGYLAPTVSADSVQFSIVPNKCISLRKGQTCYQRIQLRWQSQGQNDIQKLICLWREGDAVALNCWNGESKGKFRYNLEAEKTTSFYLVAGKEQQPMIARAEVKITWVYNNRSSGRTRWRLF